jgi:hypothetical protein
MKDFLLKAILQPFLAILFCLVFGVPFVYTGFQTVDLQGSKDDQGSVTIDFTRRHFWGLYRISEHLEGVKDASLQTNLIRRIGNRKTLTSGVFIETDTEAVRLFAGSSNVNDAVKWEAIRSINDFIDNRVETTLTKTFRVINIFGWFGLPFLILGVLGFIGWPSSIVHHWKAR